MLHTLREVREILDIVAITLATDDACPLHSFQQTRDCRAWDFQFTRDPAYRWWFMTGKDMARDERAYHENVIVHQLRGITAGVHGSHGVKPQTCEDRTLLVHDHGMLSVFFVPLRWCAIVSSEMPCATTLRSFNLRNAI
jgi:hypothetical protein